VRRSKLPGLVAQAYDPSGGYKMLEDVVIYDGVGLGSALG